MSENEDIKSSNLWSKSFDLPNQGLRAYFGRVVSGYPNEERTPFFNKKSVEEVLKGWDATLSSISSEWPSLYEFEIDLRSKVGPMSIMQPLEKRMDDIEAYYSSITKKSVPIQSSALEKVVKEWLPNGGSVTPRGQKATLLAMKKSTSSGSPYFTKRRTVMDKTVPCTVWQSDLLTKQKLNDGREYLAPAILGWRGQEGGPKLDDVKQRVVWMFPFGVNVCELQVYQPLIEYAQRHNIVPAWVGMDAVDRKITELFDTKSDSDLVVCTDFSKFDQHFNPQMQMGAKTILQGIMRPNEMFMDWISHVFPIKYSIPLAYNWESIRTGAHGMASGSGGTNADETLTHRALQYEAAMSSGSPLNPNSMCLGDDGVLTYPGIRVEDVVKTYSSHGQEMNLEKQYAATDNCTYLRRWHHKEYRHKDVCVGVYSTYRAIGRLCEQERYYDPDIWGPNMVALRQLSILENCKYHPMREEFVQFCIKGDKFRLGLDIPGFMDNIKDIAHDAIDLMPDFLGYTRTLSSEDEALGIQNWWIVNYLKSL